MEETKTEKKIKVSQRHSATFWGCMVIEGLAILASVVNAIMERENFIMHCQAETVLRRYRLTRAMNSSRLMVSGAGSNTRCGRLLRVGVAFACSSS